MRLPKWERIVTSVSMEEKENIEYPKVVVTSENISESKCFISLKQNLFLNQRFKKGLYPKLESCF